MSANPDLKRYLGPLLERRKDLLLQGRWLIVKPVTHFVRGVYFDRTRARGLTFPWAMVVPLYDGPPSPALLVGHEMRRQKKCWDLLERGGENELCDALEATALPLVENVLAPADFLHYTKTLDGWLTRVCSEAMCRFILGDRIGAERIFEDIVQKQRLHGDNGEPEPGDPWPSSISVLLEHMRSQPADLLRIMHEWEAGMVKLMKLEKYWDKQPFPCEILKYDK
jgi:hypothetical protein